MTREYRLIALVILWIFNFFLPLPERESLRFWPFVVINLLIAIVVGAFIKAEYDADEDEEANP